ncbi:MAG TPA: hypothetical protein VH638_11435 [Gemmatimonadaceae bacterium]
MQHTLARTAVIIALIVGASASAAQSLVPGQTRMRIGTTMLTVGPVTDGKVLVEAWRGMARITGAVDADVLARWTDSSWALVDGQRGVALAAVTYEYPDGSTKIEYKSPYLSLGPGMSMMIDRIDRDGASRFALYAVEAARERRVYIVMTRSDVSTLLGAMRDAAMGSIAISEPRQ